VKPPPFAYEAPRTIDEVVARKAAEGDDAVILAGGQSLIPLLALRLADPAMLIDLDRIEGLSYVRMEDDRLAIGAMARHRDVEEDVETARRFPIVADAVPLIGHRAIRNRGTVGGSVSHADPAAEWPAIAVALGASVEAVGPRGARSIAAEDFFLGPFTNGLEPDEIVREIRLPVPVGGSGFVEHSRRHGDFALAGVGAVVELDTGGTVVSTRIVLVGVGGTPVRAIEAERAIVGERLTDDRMLEAAEATRAAVEPPSSVHASSDYRRHLVGVLVGRALRIACDRARAA
jgi:aerobic carbon-monoxide dehydrogenase medium subunit